MGKGKGAPEYFVAVVRPGRILIEVAGVSEIIAKEALRLASQKLPVKTKFIIANDYSKKLIMKQSEVSKLNLKDLDAKIIELKKKLFELKMSSYVSELENPMSNKKY